MLLASADGRDISFSTLQVLLLTIIWFAVIAVLAALPILVARRRGHRSAGMILFVVLFTGFFAAGSVYFVISSRDQWAREETLRLQSGYYEGQPQEEPGFPWLFWAALAGIYGITLAWALAGGGATNAGTAAFPVVPPPPSAPSAPPSAPAHDETE